MPVEQQEEPLREELKQEVVETVPQEIVTKTIIIHKKECHKALNTTLGF